MNVELGPVLTVLGTLLTLSLLVERLLKVVDWLVQRLLIVGRTSSEDEKGLASKLDEAKAAKREESEILEGKPGSVKLGVEIEANPASPNVQPDSRFEVVELSTPDYIPIAKEYYMQLIGFIIALIGCRLMGVTAMGFFRDESGGAAIPMAWQYILTAIIIGAGSKPIHFLIEFLVNRKIEVARSTAEAKTSAESEEPSASVSAEAPTVAASAPATPRPAGIESLVGFTYDGGDRPDRLECTHLRKNQVDLIVVHHTTMHSSASFADLVKVFDNKGWLTGYHCVVFANGQIRVLCRWDRFGNHALGCNERALGIAFQGNFEPDPRIPFSNPNGQYGILYPTDEQLDSAARIAALWIQLFKIPFKFRELKPTDRLRDPKGKAGIVPHNLIADKACPGANFPFDRFEERVRVYNKQWQADLAFGKALDDFAKRPMVYA